MLTRLNENLKLVNNLGKPHKGKVVLTDVDESSKLGRIKVRIKSLIEETDTAKLPWIYPQSPTGFGGQPNSSSFMVPEVGTEVTVVFPFDDIYAGFYIGHWKSAKTLSSDLFGTDYPDVYGFVDSQIQWIKINKKSGTNEAEIYNQQGELLIKLDSTGKLMIHAKGGLEISVPSGDLDIKANVINLESDTGAINIKSKTKLNLTATTDANLKGSGNVNIQGTLIQENGTAEAATAADVDDADTAKTDADTVAGNISTPSGIGGFD